MKNKIQLFIGAVVIAVVASGLTVYAATNAHIIFDIPSEDLKASTFWHDGNRCYVATGKTTYDVLDNNARDVSISCVRYK